MIGILPCMCSSACQADSTCARLPRFQVRLDIASSSQRPRINKHTEACANHLGAVAVAMATWVREQALTNVDLTVLAIEPPSWRGYLWREPGGCAPTSGLVFSVIHLGGPEVALTDDIPSTSATWGPPDLDAEVRSTCPLLLSGSYASGQE